MTNDTMTNDQAVIGIFWSLVYGHWSFRVIYSVTFSSIICMSKAINDADFDSQVLKADKPVLLDFWAPWCGPCKVMLPIMEELETQYAGKVEIMKMNVDENMEIGRA